MNKINIKRFVILIIIVIIALGVSFFFYQTYQPSKDIAPAKPADIISKDEMNSLNLYHLGVYEAVSRDEKGKVTAYKFLGLKDPEPINLELMSDAEKVERHLASSAKAQVLERDTSGKIVAYRMINTDSDIISKY